MRSTFLARAWLSSSIVAAFGSVGCNVSDVHLDPNALDASTAADASARADSAGGSGGRAGSPDASRSEAGGREGSVEAGTSDVVRESGGGGGSADASLDTRSDVADAGATDTGGIDGAESDARPGCKGNESQACGNCGSQSRTCDKGNWSAWGACVGQGACAPNGTQSCGMNGTQTCIAQCQWGDCVGQTCLGPIAQGCDNCGTQSRACNNGVWSAWGSCANQGVCVPNATQACGTGGTQTCDPASCQWGACVTCSGSSSQACGNCGTQSRTCNGGVWSAWGQCTGQGVCSWGANQSCGSGGTQTCNAQCQWGDCTGQTCSGPSTQACGSCGTQSRTCNNGAWSAWGACSGQGVCAPNATQACGSSGTQTCNAQCTWGDCTGQTCSGSSTQACGNCGTQARTCSNGTWSAWGTCTEQGVCSPNSVQCAGNVLQACGSSCQWQNTTTCQYVCNSGACTGVCMPGAKQCSVNTPQTCDANGQWQNNSACDANTQLCLSGICVPSIGIVGPSCAGGLDCAGVSCCQSKLVPGGTFPMGRSTSGTDACPPGKSCNAWELPEHNATIDSYYLDAFEVTVGRFRKFVAAYNGTSPPSGAGDHHNLGAGWQIAWNSLLPATQATLISNLKCNPSSQTWTDVPSTNEAQAINCVTWYEAFAFCIWDGGRLPTEAEWEYAAAGGQENRLYPWGSADPSVDTELSNSNYSERNSRVNVGSHSRGNGLWGHRDLAGNMWEWAFDWYSDRWYTGAGNPCNNCANTVAADRRITVSAGWFNDIATPLRCAAHSKSDPKIRLDYLGFRCARPR